MSSLFLSVNVTKCSTLLHFARPAAAVMTSFRPRTCKKTTQMSWWSPEKWSTSSIKRWRSCWTTHKFYRTKQRTNCENQCFYVLSVVIVEIAVCSGCCIATSIFETLITGVAGTTSGDWRAHFVARIECAVLSSVRSFKHFLLCTSTVANIHQWWDLKNKQH